MFSSQLAQIQQNSELIGFICALVLMSACGWLLIAWLKRLPGMKWSPREDTPESHSKKAGVPSMGGIGLIGSALVAFIIAILYQFSLLSIVLAAYLREGTFVRAFAMASLLPLVVLAHAILGFVDDWSKARGTGGLLARQKLVAQVIFSATFVFFFLRVNFTLPNGRTPHTIFEAALLGDGGSFLIWGVLISILMALIIGTSNAVNLTDGIDGLATGLSVQVGLALVALSYLEATSYSRVEFSGSAAATLCWICLAGAAVGFLFYNKNPARVFMGDTGSLALGAALGAGAILTRSVFLLPFIGFMFYIEMFSVMAQVAYFKYTKKKTGEGKRIFRRAPLHHHFELGGWSEWRVVGTFWAVNALTTLLGLVLWKMGILPRFP